MESPIGVRVAEVSKTYRRLVALNEVSLDFGQGITAVLGRNGAGKSTLARMLVGVERPTSGQVMLEREGRRLLASEARRETGWLPQAFGFPPQMTVAEFLRYAAWLKGLAKSETAGHVDIALALADLESVRSQRLGQLSGGTLRRAGLAASLVHQPGLLILDEPTAGLDPVQRADFHIRLRTLATTRTVVLATHLLEDVHELADDIFVLDEGRVIWHGTAAELADVGGPGQQGTAGLRAGIMRLIGHTL